MDRPKARFRTAPWRARLRWRQPWPVWTAVAAALGVGAPYLVLQHEGGFGRLMLAWAGLTAMLGFALAALSARVGRPPAARLSVTLTFIAVGAVLAVAGAVLTVAGQTAAAAAAQAPNPRLPEGLWGSAAMIALIVGLPWAVFLGLVAGVVAFWREPPAATGG